MAGQQDKFMCTYKVSYVNSDKNHRLASLRRPLAATIGAALASAWLWSAPALATPSGGPGDTDNSASDVAPEPDTAIRATQDNQWTGTWSRSTLLGDIYGLRSALARYGVTFGLTETSELLGNVTGGINKGATYDGLTTGTVTIDTNKAFGLPGGTFNASALQIHGRNLSAANLDNLQTASGIEADTGTRLWELWYQQQFLNNHLDVKIGQQSLDQEFMVSTNANLFVNTMFGWAAVPSYDMPAGGPAYPLSALGIRFRAEPTHDITVLAGVFDGNPTGTSVGDPQLADAHGTNFNLHNGALYIAELQYGINQPAMGDLDDGKNHGLPGTYKIGFWYNNEQFADLRYGTDGLPLVSPNSNGNPIMHPGDYSLYAVADQMVWRPDPDGARSLNVFTRLMGAPGDRNLLSFSGNLGLVLKAPFQGRDNDSAGLALGYVKVGSAAAGSDEDSAAINGGYAPIRSSETFVEATYQYQVNQWWQLQPDVQYVMNPGGGIVNPNNPSEKIKNELIIGVRANITF
jgi:porin